METIDRERPELYEALGRTIQVLRTDQGLDRKDLADRAGISYSYLAAIENGKKPPSSKVLFAIAYALGLHSHELLASAESRLGRDHGPDLPTARDVRFRAPSLRRQWFHDAFAAAPSPDVAAEASAALAAEPPAESRPATPLQRSVPRTSAGFLMAIERLAPELTDEDRELVLDLALRLAGRTT